MHHSTDLFRYLIFLFKQKSFHGIQQIKNCFNWCSRHFVEIRTLANHSTENRQSASIPSHVQPHIWRNAPVYMRHLRAMIYYTQVVHTLYGVVTTCHVEFGGLILSQTHNILTSSLIEKKDTKSFLL